MYRLYRIIAVISIFVRQFVLPNPFEPLGETFTITIKDVIVPLHPIVLNLIAEPILHTVTFAVVGIYYHKGRNNYALGSFLYLLFYVVHVGLIYIVSSFEFAWIAIIILLVLYIAVHIAINVFRNKLNYCY